jgi:hypothetical protein
MLHRKYITAVILLVLALGTLSAKGVLAWWSGWYSPNFTGSYSPTSYQHGQWNSTVSGGTEAFGSEMQWNQSRADGVRAYSNNRNWIWFCGNCFSYYTHDHTDMSGRLDAKAYATNFPNASIDLDDDDSDGRWEEIEATSVNQSFPTAGSTYHFYSYFQRSLSGTGTLYETPQISAKNALSNEWDTWHYDSYQALSYSTTDAISQALDIESSLGIDAPEIIQLASGTPFSSTVELGGLTVLIRGNSNGSVLRVSMDSDWQSGDDLAQYINWAQTDVVTELRNADVTHALTVVTFWQPVSTTTIDALLGKSSSSGAVGAVTAHYMDKNNPDPSSNVWTVGVWPEPKSDYREALSDIAIDVSAHSIGQDTNASLEMVGIVAVQVWLPLDQVDLLNAQDDVLLADASSSYLRLVAAKVSSANELGLRLDDHESNLDGLPKYIVAEARDIYAESRVFFNHPR